MFDDLKTPYRHGILSVENFVNILVTNNDFEQAAGSKIVSRNLHSFFSL